MLYVMSMLSRFPVCGEAEPKGLRFLYRDTDIPESTILSNKIHVHMFEKIKSMGI